MSRYVTKRAASSAGLFVSAAVFLAAVVGCGGQSLQSRGGSGVELTLRAVPSEGQPPITSAQLQKAADIVRNRMRKLGAAGKVTTRPGSDELVVRIDGARLRPEELHLLDVTAQLMLFDFENDLTGPSRDANGSPVASPSLYGLLSKVQRQAAGGKPEAYYLFNANTSLVTRTPSLIAGPSDTKAELLREVGGKVPKNGTILAVPSKSLVVSCPVANGCLGIQVGKLSRNGGYYYLLKYDPQNKTSPVPEMNGSDLVPSGTKANFGQAGNPVVLLQFTRHGSRQFGRITRQEAQRGQTKYNLAGKQGDYLNYVQHFAIVLDGVLQSTPYIDFKQNPDGIPGPNAQIDMGNGGTFQDAKNLALLLQTGALPVTFLKVSERAER